MAHVSADTDTTASAQTVIGALTDFSEERVALWPNIDRKYYKVHGVGRTSAEVTEGSRGVWERTRYDWSQPGTVRIEVQDSSISSRELVALHRPATPGGRRSHVHLEFQRRPRSRRGLTGALLSVFGKKIFGSFLEETLRRLELGLLGMRAMGRRRSRVTLTRRKTRAPR